MTPRTLTALYAIIEERGKRRNMNELWIGLVTGAGGVLLWLLGYLKSGEAFDGKKFGLAMLFAVGGGLVAGLSYNGATTWKDAALAILAGAGVEGLGYAGVKTVAAKL
jgi:hypothetical protein